MLKLKAITLGCSKNRVDTEHLLAQLPSDVFVVAEDAPVEEPADVLLLNTCGFIQDAKQESIDAIMEAIEFKKRGLAGRVVVWGCLSGRYDRELPSLIPEVDAWFGATDTEPVLRYLGFRPDHRKALHRVPSECGPGTAYLKISEGCDRRCSYCAIPFIRGAHKSVPIEELVQEASLLAGRGVKELVLIAQDTTYYGLDIYGRRALADLLKALSQIQGIEWIRIHYSYPADFPEDVLEQMASDPKVCKYLDIPLQHISDKVLSNMRRRVDGAWTRSLVQRLRSEVPGVVLRTTMIVGHPGEGEKEFEELMEFCREARFERLGAFKYSEEEGTWGAEHFIDSVSEAQKQMRYDRLMEQQAAISLEFNRSRVGKVERVIADSIDGNSLVCRSQSESPEVDGIISVSVPQNLLPGAAELVGNFVNARIIAADLYDLEAELVA